MKKRTKTKGKAHTEEVKKYKREIGRRIREIREKVFGENQTRLAKRLGIPQSHVSNIENGNTFPTIPLLNKITLISDVRWDWLMTGNGEMFEDQNQSVENKNLKNYLSTLESKMRVLEENKKKQDVIISNQNILIEMLRKQSN